MRLRALRRPGGPAKDDWLAIEIHEVDRRLSPYRDDDLIPDSKGLPSPFDFERLTRFMSYGFLMAPIQHQWVGFLNRTFPITATASTLPALKRVAFDQLLFAPVGALLSSSPLPCPLLHRFPRPTPLPRGDVYEMPC